MFTNILPNNCFENFSKILMKTLVLILFAQGASCRVAYLLKKNFTISAFLDILLNILKLLFSDKLRNSASVENKKS